MKYITTEEIQKNPYQPRGNLDEDTLEEMVASIKRYGMLQPILVRKVDGGYQIAAGERRYRAALKAGLKEIPIIERVLTDREMLEIALIENVHREEISPVDKAKGLKRLMEEFGMTQGELGKVFGMSRPAIANSVRLLGLPEEARLALERKEITEGHARAILGIKNKKVLDTVLGHIKEKRITVRECEEIVRKTGMKPGGKESKSEKKEEERKYEEILTEILGTKVRIRMKGERGKIEIEFYSKDDIERIIDKTKNY